MKLIHQLDEENLQDLINFSAGVFYPLDGFMASRDYRSVVDHMRLDDGSVWSIPLTLDISPDLYRDALHADRLFLMYDGQEVGFIEIDDCYRINLREDAAKVFKTDDVNHPAVRKELSRSEYRTD